MRVLQTSQALLNTSSRNLLRLQAAEQLSNLDEGSIALHSPHGAADNPFDFQHEKGEEQKAEPGAA